MFNKKLSAKVLRDLSYYICVGCQAKSEEVRVVDDLYYCEECGEGAERRLRLLRAEKEWDEATVVEDQIETVE